MPKAKSAAPTASPRASMREPSTATTSSAPPSSGGSLASRDSSRAAPLVAWPGGKTRLLKHLLPLLERCPHKTYVEPFGGGAAVLLAKRPAPLEVLNDLNGELMNLYRCARHHTRELLRLVRAMPGGRAVFREVKTSRPETDLLRAARTFYLLKCSVFGQAHSWRNAPMGRGLGK